jgi:hypothetical protein
LQQSQALKGLAMQVIGDKLENRLSLLLMVFRRELFGS